MRPTTGAEAEAWVLTTEAGRALLVVVSAVAAPGPADLSRWRRGASAEHVSAALRLADGRRRGAAKFARADRMWFEPTGLEQATSEPVARHKARRFEGRAPVVVDLCCGIGGDTVALAGAGPRVLAVDRDVGMCRRTVWNAAVYEVADRVAAVRSRAETFQIPVGAWVHVDPDRRARGGRAQKVDRYEPGVPFLRSLATDIQGGALKLGPASDFAEHFGGPGFEVELISLAGECKEATVWFGEAVTCRRRATRLPEAATWTDCDSPDGATATVGPIGSWVFDPDPSLGRVGLLDGFAAAHGLSRFAAGIDYLTGQDRVESPFLAAFEVIDVLPLDLKALRRGLSARGLGLLEVKTRGLDLRPEAVRARLRPQGDLSATLLLAGGTEKARAILAKRPST
jgi:hypothetical protein